MFETYEEFKDDVKESLDDLESVPPEFLNPSGLAVRFLLSNIVYDIALCDTPTKMLKALTTDKEYLCIKKHGEKSARAALAVICKRLQEMIDEEDNTNE